MEVLIFRSFYRGVRDIWYSRDSIPKGTYFRTFCNASSPKNLIRTSKIEIYDTDHCAIKNNHEENHIAMCQEISFTQASTIEGRLEKRILFKPTMMMVSKTKRVKHSRQTSQSKRYPSPPTTVFEVPFLQVVAVRRV